ncbi:PEP-CTERM sorting domain-containing protein [Altererythrobacter sp. SALINAS58]|uniref:FxDxF family PEP-CTERM protein n=1 Tax=Alteripontixanthobacter muriae TaxID=2705546 RepID=UPI001575C487|nr:FxDxF family PEP-CTERM protein [Alteripontixanthobacter muriae]NTZ42124.1 PEP-CTERM sorting domain-containing protein [Alteripontixanthobacter muriae]
MKTKHILLTLGAASALAIGGSASAAVTIDSSTITSVDGPSEADGTTTISFDEAGLARPTFMESLTFTNTLAGLYALTVDTSSSGVDFTSIFLSGSSGTFDLTEAFDNGTVEFWQMSNVALDAGQYTLNIMGDNRGTGSLAGTITIGQAVPEPGTWAMMLLGFGAIGFAMRRRRDTQGTKRIRLAYS